MLKLQYFGHVVQRADLLGKTLMLEKTLEKTLMLGKTEGKRRRVTEDELVGWRHGLYGHEFKQAPGD